MKKIIVFLIIPILIFSISGIPSYAVSNNYSNYGIAKELLNSDVIFETFSEIGAVVESGDGEKIFYKVIDVYPLWIEQIRAIKEDFPYSYTSDGSEKADALIVEKVLKQEVIFDDLNILIDVESTKDEGKIFLCILEIYPDIVKAFYNIFNEYEEPKVLKGTSISEGSITIVACIVSAVVFGLGGFLLGRRSTSSSNEEFRDDGAE